MPKKLTETKAPNTAKSEYNRCISCRKPCSMSGLCMMHWPEFNTPKLKSTKIAN
jgi:hypothetical protein